MRSLIETRVGTRPPATAEQLTRLVPDYPPSPHYLATMNMYLAMFNEVGRVGADIARSDTLDALEGRLSPFAVVQRFNLALHQGPIIPPHLIEYGQLLIEVADSTDPLPNYTRIPEPGSLPDWLTIHFGDGKTIGGWDNVKIKIIDAVKVGRVVAIDAIPTLIADPRETSIRLASQQSYSPWIVLPEREPSQNVLDAFKKSLRALMVNYIGGLKSVDALEILPGIIRFPTALFAGRQRLNYREEEALGRNIRETTACNLAVLRAHETKMNQRLASVAKDVFAAFRDNVALFDPPIAPYEAPFVMQHLLTWLVALAALQGRELTVLDSILRAQSVSTRTVSY